MTTPRDRTWQRVAAAAGARVTPRLLSRVNGWLFWRNESGRALWLVKRLM